MQLAVYICLSIAILPYVLFIGYFLVNFLTKGKTTVSHTSSPNFIEPVSIILVGYNEENYVHSKIQSLLHSENWISGSEIIVVSGGSTDETSRKILEYKNHPDVQLYLFDTRITKIKGVNIAASKARHNILIFSDFRQEMKTGSIHRLIQHFKDPSIGTVSSTLVDTSSSSPSLARSILNSTAINASQTSSSLNIFGALYAQRKSSFRTIPEDIIFDDLFVTASTLAQQKRLIQEPDAIIYDVNFEHYYGKERIMRLARGLLLFLMNHSALINSLPLKTRIQFLIYKYMKLLFPISLTLLIAGLLFLCLMQHYLLPLLIFGVISTLFIFPKTRQLTKHFFAFHYYFGSALFLFCTGKERSVLWEKLSIAE